MSKNSFTQTLIRGAPAALTVTALLLGCSAPGASSATVTLPGGEVVRVDVASTATEQRDGLSGRNTIPDGTGMVFLFSDPGVHQVWMADMSSAIDVAWIADQTVLEVLTLEPCTLPTTDQCPQWDSPASTTMLLETAPGALGAVAPGSAITISYDK